MTSDIPNPLEASICEDNEGRLVITSSQLREWNAKESGIVRLKNDDNNRLDTNRGGGVRGAPRGRGGSRGSSGG